MPRLKHRLSALCSLLLCALLLAGCPELSRPASATLEDLPAYADSP